MKPKETTSDCDDRRVRQFVDGKLPEQDLAAFEIHLDNCAPCRESVQTQTADQDEWQKAGLFLRDDDSDLECLSSLLSSGECVDGADQSASRMATQQAVSMLAPTDDPHMLGRIGSYEVCGLIGSGGMGVVFKAFDCSLNRFVAIKMLAPHLATIGSARRRFARESQAAAAVVHDNVIEIYGVSADHDPPYLVMPYVGGISLQKRLMDSGPLSVAEILRIGMQTAAGLASAHDQGLVHRDIKPANILLPDGVERVRITDFGLARAADDASLTRSGVIAGTPQFMSPEQARGESVDGRSDLFSLGSVLYMLCTGRAPFRAETSYGVLRRITDSQPRPIREINPEIPEWLCTIVNRLHEKSPEDRYASAAEVSELLSECLQHVQTPDKPLPSSQQAVSVAGSARKRTLLTAAALLIVGSIGGSLFLLTQPERETTTEGNLPISNTPKTNGTTDAVDPNIDEDTVWNDTTDISLWTLHIDIEALDQAVE